MEGYLLYPSGINYKFTQTKKHKQMKKVLFVLALGAFAACGTTENKEVKADSTAVTTDTAAAKVDTAAVKVDSAAVKVDSAAKK